MTEYAREREHRRRSRSLLGVVYLAAMSGSLAIKTGWVAAMIALVAVLVLVYAVVTVIVWRDGRAEARRRAAGAPPSWPAQLPVVVAQQMGAKAPGRHSRQQEVGELLGRLSLVDGELRWEPRKAGRKRAVRTIVWDKSWSPEVTRIWGLGSQGHLTLTHPDGTVADLWIRHPADILRILGLSGTH
jgi:hypothetical protein